MLEGRHAALAASGGRPRRVIGIDASAKPVETRDQVTRIARRAAADHAARSLPRLQRNVMTVTPLADSTEGHNQ
jgi:1-aminocyclopropane-1-carboxylate deaminase/D-cysteine desulfhydrase-like pyridoxal-dependent ACC family enzyme